tara:strand:+ start:2675 stop:3448 length:774 start_codon:yes stop_codon:yes gene_type:complete
MFINNFDPVAFELFNFQIRWYSLSYIFGILFGWAYCKKIINDKNFEKIFDDLINLLILGIIVGGRLGYVIFYNLSYYINNPIEIFMIWNGGMSFHGGLLGIIIVTIGFGRKKNINPFKFLDLIAISAPIGIFFGRISNFINSELYGRATDIYWSVIFTKVDNITRHPSQLYEAFFEGIILFIIMNYFLKKKLILNPGLISSFFLIFYSFFRFFIEFLRQPDEHLGFIILNLSTGQIISAGFFLAGLILLFQKKNEIK